ncbi:MAG: hypothetical protein QOG91_703 [Candidatus Parcubacteria bacterium]|jgi:hypothetical protein|nr:hypothetical protein [Candidatus Parcubacteria bacterium]
MKTLSPLLVRAALATGLLLGAFALVAVAQGTTFVGAPGTPPTCPDTVSGCHPPLNNDLDSQIKQGGLWLKGLSKTTSLPMVYGLVVENVPIWAQGGLIIQACVETACPGADANHPVSTGQMWMVTSP